MKTLPQKFIDKIAYNAVRAYISGSGWDPTANIDYRKLEGACELIGADHTKEQKRVEEAAFCGKTPWDSYVRLGKKHGWPHR